MSLSNQCTTQKNTTPSIDDSLATPSIHTTSPYSSQPPSTPHKNNCNSMNNHTDDHYAQHSETQPNHAEQNPSSIAPLVDNTQLQFFYTNFETDPQLPILQPHVDITTPMTSYHLQQSVENHVNSIESLQESSQLYHRLNTELAPSITTQLKQLNKHHTDITRIQGKLMIIFKSLRKMRRQLDAVGVKIEGELDPVQEIERKDHEELQKAREEYQLKKKLGEDKKQLQKEGRQQSDN